MPIALGLNPAWTGPATTASLATAAFSPTAGSLIIVEAHLDSTAASIAPTITDSVGLTWTAIGTPQRGSSGGFSAAWWAYTAVARTNMTAAVNWAGSAAQKAIKPTTWTGTATAAAVVSKAQAASGTNNLTVNVATTNANCRIMGTALDWNANGLPASTDTELGYHLASLISGASAHKAANTATPATSVPINFDAFGTAAALWTYKVFEIVPAAGGATVTGDATLAVTTTITAAGTVTTPAVQGDATLAVTTTLASTGQLGAAAGTTLAASTTITAAGSRGQATATALAATTTVTTTGSRGQATTTTLAAVTTLATSGGLVATSTTTLATTTTVDAAGLVGSPVQPVAVTTTITAAGTRQAVATTTLAVVTTVTVVGRLGARGSTTLAIVTALTAAALLAARSAVALAVATTLTAAAEVVGPLTVVQAGQIQLSSPRPTTTIGEAPSPVAVSQGSGAATVIGDSTLSRMV